MPFPDLPPERIPGSPGHLNDHQLIDQALDYIQQSGYRDDPNFPPLPDVPVLGQSGHVTAHDRILAILEYVKGNPSGAFVWATVSNTPTGTYKGSDGHTYAYYLFESDGTLTVTTAGLLEVLLVSGGGGQRDGTVGGAGGYIVTGLHPFAAGAQSVTIGSAGPKSASYSGTTGGRTSVGAVTTGATGIGLGTAATSGDWRAPYTSTITGSPVKVSGRPKNGAQYGGGAEEGNGQPAQPGVAIVKTRLN